IRLAVGVDVRARLDEDILRPGSKTRLYIETNAPEHSITPQLPDGWHMDGNMLEVSQTPEKYNAYPSRYIPGRPDEPNLKLRISAHGVASETLIGFETPPVILPASTAILSPDRAVINTQFKNHKISITVHDVFPDQASVRLDVSANWSAPASDSGFELSIPDNVSAGVHNIGVSVNGESADNIHLFDYDHIDTRMRSFPAALKICAVDAKLPTARIGYIGGGNDRVNYWLKAMGLNVHDMQLGDFTRAKLQEFDTIVVGIFAVRTQSALRDALPQIHQWINDGGHLLTLYHRPWDAWDPKTVPPRHLEIGKPSLRWRVTDENAEVTYLEPDHPLLNSPNKITQEDWAGWHKERGLYFAKSWDPAYVPLLSMNDPDEEPHKGALLSAEIGKGRHTHTSLILHHQLENLVPGAFRLMANLVSNE
ncbi:MAG: PIG-L family deacetylase, partial [Rhizobiales bacterium]|nr:PIG-L family deacetylase [Hyphomicrobiales bacterium]